MADNTGNKGGAGVSAPNEPEDTFEVDDLIERAGGFFRRESYVVAAALHGRTAKMTLSDAKARIEAWLDEPQTKEA